ncbi:hypothetical protein quinque_000538 [Culex quinquefasciatus]
MFYVPSLLVLAVALRGTASSCPDSPHRLLNLGNCIVCQLRKFNFSALNRYSASQLGVLQLIKPVAYQSIEIGLKSISNTTAILRIGCTTAGPELNRCASAVLVQDQHSGQGRTFLQTIRSTNSGTLQLDNDWLEIGPKPNNARRSPAAPTETNNSCWSYDEWKTPCNISRTRYRELANEMSAVVWSVRKSKQTRIIVVAVLTVTIIVALSYVVLNKSFVRVAPTALDARNCRAAVNTQ